MHPTDTLLAVSHARVARAAAAGPRKAQQPTALTDQQHLARLERFERGDTLVFRQNGTILRLRALNEAEGRLARQIDAL